ncbi:MAG TPA: hypothetical protein VGE06_04140 [Flavisolibacter sp.]
MKSWPTALFASAVIIAGAIVFAATSPAISQQRGAGFMMAASGANFAWRVNTVTGAVSYCARRSDSTDPSYLANNAPVCSAFTAPAQ